ncbi:unnamed protein product [Ilex paraguariensis]|uniref:Uncharacterized protein n=1 Tax=Ilex paraguariensis TaxID=185542 RepID=A0ABC8RQ57_9AQUA
MQMYGYLTNTKVKFILVTTDLDVRDADVRNPGLVFGEDGRIGGNANLVTQRHPNELWSDF